MADRTPITWDDALQGFKKDFSTKDLNEIKVPTKPEDLINHLKEWRLYRQGKSGKAIKAVQIGVARVQSFNNCIDTLSQGLPTPATLLWGSIKFVLKIVEDHFEEHDKICEAFAGMVEALPRIEMYADTFPDSTILHDSIHDVFMSSLRFWMKACKFYRRRKLFAFVRSTWNNYEIEFRQLEKEMGNAVTRVEKDGLVEHVKESKAFRLQKQEIQESVSKLRRSETLAELASYLATSTGDMKYYIGDHENAQKLRYSGTCGWISEENGIFDRWSKALAIIPHTPATFPRDPFWPPSSPLWINGGPGMGKTVLHSAMIDHLKSSDISKQHPVLLYFHFKRFGSDDNSTSGAMFSFLYQILVQNENNPEIESRILDALDNAISYKRHVFDSLWWTLENIIQQLPAVTFLLDGLDECSQARSFIRKLRDLA